MVQIRFLKSFIFYFFILIICSSSFIVIADSSYLYGIHWYGDVGSSDVEAMSDSKGIYVLEQVLPNGESWERASSKVWNFSQIVSKGHTIIVRIHPNWGLAVPKPGDTYSVTDFVNDCRDSANTLKDYVHIWHLGNEMNILQEYGDEQLTPSYYIDVYKQVYSAIHEITSPLGEQIVLLGPVSPGNIISGVRWMTGNDYLAQMCTLLSTSETDGFAMHSYGGGDLSSSLTGFRGSYQEQLGIIDTYGFTDKAVYITEWNRHTPDPSYEAISAQFLYNAFDELNDWNQAPGHHNIICACWFVYPSGVGWDDYSIHYYKTPGGTKDDDLWAAFQYAAQQNYPAGAVGGGGDPGINGGFFNEEFTGSSLDTSIPEPVWVPSSMNGHTITVSGGFMTLKGNSGSSAYGGILNDGYYYDDFEATANVTFVDITTLGSGQANTEIRFRERTNGYSLTLDAYLDQISLRRAGPWTTIQSTSYSINNGDSFNIKIICDNSNIKIQIGTAPGGTNNVVDWNITNSDYSSGLFRIHSWCIEEVKYDYFRVEELSQSSVDCWYLLN